MAFFQHDNQLTTFAIPRLESISSSCKEQELNAEPEIPELEVVEPELPSTSKPEVVPETSTSKPPPPEPENPSTGGAATNSTEPPPTVQPGPVTFSPSKPGESLESVHIHVSISVPEK